MELFLPYSIGSRDLPSLFSLCAQIKKCQDSNIILNASRVEFIDPQGFTILAALLSSRSSLRISMPWLSTKIAGYMSRMDFFKYLDIQDVEIPEYARHDQREGLTELTCVESYADSDVVANKLADAITGSLTNAPDSENANSQFGRFRHPIWYSLSELLDNSLTHARQQQNQRATVWVAAQYYKSSGFVKMSVVDNGCGMLATLKNHPQLTEKSHFGAISTALIPKVSCNRDGMLYNTHGNQGVGLTTTARIAKSAAGGLTISSGDSYLLTSSRVGGIWPHEGHWDGVSIGFSCRRRALPSIRLRELLPKEDDPLEVSFL